MIAAQNGDKYAYATLLTAIEKLARVYVFSRIANKNDAADVVQEMLISIHKARATYQPERPFYPWAYAIFKYRLQDYFRRHYRLKEREEAQGEALIEDEKAINPETATEQKELSEKLLSYLKPKQRRIVEMLYLEGNSAQEVSDEMEITVSDVRTTAHRAMKELKHKAEKVG